MSRVSKLLTGRKYTHNWLQSFMLCDCFLIFGILPFSLFSPLDWSGIDLENIVYYKDDTHYFVMTAKKNSLLKKGVIKQVRPGHWTLQAWPWSNLNILIYAIYTDSNRYTPAQKQLLLISICSHHNIFLVLVYYLWFNVYLLWSTSQSQYKQRFVYFLDLKTCVRLGYIWWHTHSLSQ